MSDNDNNNYLDNNNDFPWMNNDNYVDIELVEQAFHRLFSSKEGSIIWDYFNRTILNLILSSESSDNFLQYYNGQRNLVLQMKALANRGKRQ